MAQYKARPVIVEAHKILAVRQVLPGERAVDLQNGAEYDVSSVADWWIRVDIPGLSGQTAVPREMTARIEPKVGDYHVKQEDGYCYLNPKDVFERKYEPV